ncbi:protein kinase domain containing protein [Acanthamoeba castellanii str. Neff]|uniref:mitogen-activated protein kinase kinase n=1 Tax=Acanthamoeba castellanii (strain ATCC 30010 / Neff) TaxID=1257118 RepID=L8H6Z0_ACACF|nr:protein kinase domain containing protein [Acanthamoeba castellanii str. Neff]ELR20997.1 protein kinase domain containing protein [Acanthamoeba castellanii str. Neff]
MENAKFVEEAGYRLTSDEIDRGSSSEVYKCVRQKDGVPVRVKVLSLSFPMPRHLSNFQHEYNIVESLKTVTGVVAIYDRISRHNFEALVLEDFGGDDLFKCLERDGPFAAHLEQFIDIAISLAISLGQIHSHSIVHKDIKPANIIWNRQTGVVKLTDLGIASVVIRSKDTNQGRVPFQALGSLPYLPPELSVRTESKSIDHRSDFYSLGVSFFQLLTGRLPFQEKTPIRLLHAHMAKPTPRLHEVDARVIGICEHSRRGDNIFNTCFDRTTFTQLTNNLTLYPNITFKFPGVQVDLMPHQYLRIQLRSSYCVELAIAPIDNTLTILGDTFMRDRVTIFDRANKRVGFTNARAYVWTGPPAEEWVWWTIACSLAGFTLYKRQRMPHYEPLILAVDELDDLDDGLSFALPPTSSAESSSSSSSPPSRVLRAGVPSDFTGKSSNEAMLVNPAFDDPSVISEEVMDT